MSVVVVIFFDGSEARECPGEEDAENHTLTK